MTLRQYLQQLDDRRQILHTGEPIKKTYEIAGALKQLEPRPVIFENVKESDFRVAGNLFCTKDRFASYFNIPVNQIIPTLAAAIDHRSDPRVVEQAPCQEVVNYTPDLNRLPILRHCELDGGNYISSGVMVSRHPVYGQNLDFHRLMQFSPTEMAVRVVRGRHFDRFLRDQGQVDVAVCIGSAPNVLAAAATSVELAWMS
jgi:UbiD family decarboxylase